MADLPRPNSKRATIVRWALRLVGPVILAVTIARLPQPEKLWHLLLSARAWPIAAAVALNAVPLYLKAVRWRLLLATRKIDYPTRSSFQALAASLYLGMLTPGRVGDVVRVQYVKHEAGAPYSEGLASIVLDRLADLYVLVGFVSVAVVHYGAALDPKLRAVSWVMVGGTLLGPLVLFVPGLAERVLHAVYTRMSKSAGLGESGWPRFLEAVRSAARGALVPVFLLTLASFVTGYGQGWLCARAMGLDLSFFECTCLIAVQSLMGLLPISVSGIGVREAFFAAVFPSLGYSAAEGTGFGLLVFFVVYAALVAVGAVAWQIKPPPTAS
jgi:uncharacterized protein (TIRG00374 family)